MPSALSEFIRVHHQEILEAWERSVREQFHIAEATKPLLLDDIPDYLEEIALCLSLAPERWNNHEGAKKHGRQRLELGIKIDQLVREFGIVGEVIVALAGRHGVQFENSDLEKLFRLIGAGAAQSTLEYAELRDRQIEQATAEHFSFMAHEIRNPLQTARIAGQLLQSQAPRDDKTYVRLERAHDRLTELVNNAILAARLYGKPRLHLEHVELSALCHDLVEEMRAQAEGRSIAIECVTHRIEAQVDRKLIYSAVTNLLGNAIKFTHSGGRIALRLTRQEDPAGVGLARIEIEDECGGLPRELSEELFQPFVQEAKDRSGFGIGLSIVEQAARAHGGSVAVQNLVGKGCCFSLVVPLVS